MPVNSILVTETTPKVSRSFRLDRSSGRGFIEVLQNGQSIDVRAPATDNVITLTVNEAKALIEVLQELTK